MSYDPRLAGALCDDCPYKGKAVVPPEGPADAAVAIVGESPGFNEEREGRPFVGRSGLLLNSGLSRHGLRRDSVFITNVTLCRPDEIRIGSDTVKDDAKFRKAMRCCIPRLERELIALQSTGNLAVIIPMGRPAVRAVTRRHNLNIQTSRGFVWEWTPPSMAVECPTCHSPPWTRCLKKDGTVLRGFHEHRKSVRFKDPPFVVPTVHPAYVLRAPLWSPVFHSDLDRAVRTLIGQLDVKAVGTEGMVLGPKFEDIEKALSKLGKVVEVDVETTKERPEDCTLLCVGVSDGTNTVVLPWYTTEHIRTPFYGSKQSRVADLLREWMGERTIVTHNGPNFDHIVLSRYGIDIEEDALNWEDTLLAHHAFASHMPQRLDHVVSMYLDAPPWKIVSRRPAKQTDEKGAWDPLRLEDEELWFYCAQDNVLGIETWKAMQGDLAPEQVVYEGDKDTASFCRRMQENGMWVDAERRCALANEFRRRQAAYLGLLRKQAGFEGFTPTKLADLRRALFDVLHAPVLYKTIKTNSASTDVNTLMALSQRKTADGLFARTVLKWRSAVKLRRTYIEGPYVGSDGRVHPNWRAWGTPSGRLACRDPNIQNLKRGDVIRSMYGAPKGRVLVSIDYAQLEMRIGAYLSGDEAFIDAVESEDVHLTNALVLFGTMPEKEIDGGENPQWKKMRNSAKTAGFAMNYGATIEVVHARMVAEGLKVSVEHVQAMLRRLKTKYHRFFEWQEELLKEVAECGYMRLAISKRISWFGPVPEAPQVMNRPIQGGAADIVNVSLPAIEERLPSDSFFVAQVHDQGIIECPAWRAERIARLCKEIAERPVEIGGREVVFPVDVSIGPRWSELKEWRENE